MRTFLIIVLSLALLALVAWQGTKEALTPLVRDHIEKPVYAVGEAIDPGIDLQAQQVVVFGPAFWGQYPGARVFASIDEAERYLVENNKVIDGWAIYQLSGDFARDTYLENGLPHLNKSLTIKRLVKKPSMFNQDKGATASPPAVPRETDGVRGPNP